MSGREDRVLAELLRVGPAVPSVAAPRYRDATLNNAAERLPRRPPITKFLEAIEQAGRTIAANKSHIRELEEYVDDIDEQNRNLHDQVDVLGQRLRATETSLRAVNARASRAENSAVHQTKRIADLETDLAKVHGLLAQVTDTIAGSLGVPSVAEADAPASARLSRLPAPVFSSD